MTRRSGITVETYSAACEELVAIWDAHPAQVTFRAKEDVLARVLYGLAVHVASGARSIQLLVSAGRVRDTYPLVRKRWISRGARPVAEVPRLGRSKRLRIRIDSTVQGDAEDHGRGGMGDPSRHQS